MSRPHTNREYEEQLTALRERLLLMAGRVEQMIADSVEALVSRDAELAKATIAADARVNRDEMDIDEMCLVVLATRQPMASDLRFLTTALKMVTDMERIGDLAVNVCERSIDLLSYPQFKPFVDTPMMADVVQSMVRDAIDAFVERDAEKAEAVIERDDEVDQYYHRIFRDILETMHDPGVAIDWGIHIQSAAKYIERMGDHATNLAELVIFLVRGKDIRHVGKR